MLGLLGKKLGMTQLFDDAGERVSVTVIKAGPCVIARRKTIAADGYDAVAVGFEPATKEKKITKPIAGLYKKAGVKPHKFLKEIGRASCRERV